MLVLLSTTVAAALQNAYKNPTEFAVRDSISICAGNVAVTQDPNFLTMLPAQAQTLPLAYVSKWPAWVTRRKDSKIPVTLVPGPAKGADILDTWAPPAAFEQLWLPEDLPRPRARAALGLVLRNGEPRYIFPTVDALLTLPDGTQWRNRGINSLPLASTWLHFGEIPVDRLQLTAAYLPPPAAEEERSDDSDGAATSPAAAVQRSIAEWRPCFKEVSILSAVEAAFDALDRLPDKLQRSSLGDGFSYLITPLEATDDDSSSLDLPEAAFAEGTRLRIFLSEEGGAADAWQIGEADWSMWRLPPGKESPYMQAAYKPLFATDWS